MTLGVSVLFAAGVFVGFALTGSPLRGAAGGAVIIAAGVWEWRIKRKGEIRAERLEAEAEVNKQKRRR